MLTKPKSMAVLSLALLFALAACSDRDPAGLPVARAPIDPVVFDDDYGQDVYFQAFFQTNLEAVSVDSVYAYGGLAADGARSLKVHVAPQGSALGLYSGGVLTSGPKRDLADFNALTFYARATNPLHLDVAGFGNDNTGTSLYEAGRANIPLTRDWTFVVVPIPNAAKLLAERGLFTFAESVEPQHSEGYDVWFDDIRFAKLSNITDPRPFMPSSNNQYFIGSQANFQGTKTTFSVDGADVVVDHLPGYFDFSSSNPGVAAVDREGIHIVGEGDATITATLGDTPVDGMVTLSGYRPPSDLAPAPTQPTNEVISLFSSAYVDIPIDTWNTHWQYSTAQEGTYSIDDHNLRMYSTLNFVGIEFLSRKVDATAMNYFHMDVYAPFGTNFKVKFVTFTVNNGFAGQTELTFDADSDPAFTPGQWSSLDIPLSAFTFQPSQEDPWARIGQLVLSTDDAQLVLLDNLYWHQ